MSDWKLGKKVEPAAPPPPPEWKTCDDGRFQVNAKGQKRTAIPGNEQADMPPPPYGWPNWAGPVIGSTPLPVIDEDNS